MRTQPRTSLLGRLVRRVLVLMGSAILTALLFLILPVIQAITETPPDRVSLVSAEDIGLPPPPPPPELEEPEQEPEDEPPPEASEPPPPLDLSMLELALDAGAGGGWMGGDFGISLEGLSSSGEDVQNLLDMGELDQEPRIIDQTMPTLDSKARRRTPGEVRVILLINEQGRVEEAKVRRSSDKVFEQPALKAVKRWRFEPGKRGGAPVSSRKSITISFPKS